MGDQRVIEEVGPSAFVSSWIGRARPGDRFDPDPARRSAAWAQWAASSLTRMTGMSDRPYVAFRLEGRFHDPQGRGPLVPPHLEIPVRVLDRADPEFPDRLAQIGNGLAFPWWIPPEVTAAKRCLFNTARGEIASLTEVLNDRRVPLTDAVSALSRTAAPRWSDIEALLVDADDCLAGDATDDIDTAEVADYFPAGAAFELRATYDERLRASAGLRAARRVGVWQLHGVNTDGAKFSLAVVTPRLTANSQFRDRLFELGREAPAALLVRGLLLRRLVNRHLGGTGGPVSSAAPRTPAKASLRSVVAQPGHKMPEASLRVVTNFLHAYPNADDAWDALTSWARAHEVALTVDASGFAAAHRSALRAVRRADQPERDSANVVLPLGWDAQNRVVRVTYTQPRDHG